MRKNEKIARTIKIGRDISVIDFLKTRFLTPSEIINGYKAPLFEFSSKNRVGKLIFSARYNAGKAIEGYDFI